MAKLGETIKSAALTGIPLTPADRAVPQVSAEMEALKAQVALLTSLLTAKEPEPTTKPSTRKAPAKAETETVAEGTDG